MRNKKPLECYNFIVTSGTDARKRPASFSLTKRTIVIAIAGIVVVITISLGSSVFAFSKITGSQRQIQDLTEKINQQSQLLDEYSKQITGLQTSLQNKNNAAASSTNVPSLPASTASDSPYFSAELESPFVTSTQETTASISTGDAPSAIKTRNYQASTVLPLEQSATATQPPRIESSFLSSQSPLEMTDKSLLTTNNQSNQTNSAFKNGNSYLDEDCLNTIVWPFLDPNSGYEEDWPGPDGYYHAPRGGSLIHAGIDICANHGTAMYAVVNGDVVSNSWNNGGGWMAEIRNDEGYTFRYLHMDEQSVLALGTKVYAGKTVIGYCGNTGGDYPNHLHLSIYLPDSSQTVDPSTYLKAAQKRFEAQK